MTHRSSTSQAKRRSSLAVSHHSKILKFLLIISLPVIILIVGGLVLGKPVAATKINTDFEADSIQHSAQVLTITHQIDTKPDESTFESVGAEFQPLNDDAIAAGYVSNQVNDPSFAVAAHNSAVPVDPNRYTKDPLQLLAESGGGHSIPDPLKPDTQNTPMEYPQAVGNYQPDNQAINTVQYHYNGDGHLVGKTQDGVRTDFALDVAGDSPEVIYTSEGNAYLHLPGMIMTENADGDVRYLLSDGLGSVRQVVDETGQVVASYEFDPYGNPVNEDGGDPYGYTGEWWESDVGLLHLRARWYSPEAGVFLSKDNWDGDVKRPQTLNGWKYVEGNPINFTDPLGYCKTLPHVGPSDCDKFVAEVDRFIALAQAARSDAFHDNNEHQGELTVHLLAQYYAGIRATTDWELFGRPMAIPSGWISLGHTPERWPVQDAMVWRVFEQPPVEGAEEAALKYGFKRVFYNNTHHYFANFYEAWFYGSSIARYHNNSREADQFREGQNDYADSAADILVVEIAIDHKDQTQGWFYDDLNLLPSLLQKDACGDSIEEIYSGWGPNPVVEDWLGPTPP